MSRSRRWKLPVVAVGLGVVAQLVVAGNAGATRTSISAARPAGAISAARCAANRAAGTIHDLAGSEFGTGAGGIEDFVAQKLGFFAEECLTVDIITASADPTEVVASGAGQMGGAGSAADFLESVANGANLEAVATFGDTSPYTILTQSSITNLKQLEGKTFGYHTTIPVILLEELKKAGVNTSQVDFVNDTSYNPDLLPEGKFAAIQAYTDNEPLTLRSQNLPFREWDPSKFGVTGTYDPEYFNRTFLKKHPTAVADFERADIYALTYCYTHALKCVKIEQAVASAAGASFPIEHKIEQFNLAAHIVEKSSLPGLGVGVETYQEWTPEYEALKSFGIDKTLPPLQAVENTTIVASLYNGTRLIWPGP
jgi:NitT/TauT family transport system substrate-binding protein